MNTHRARALPLTPLLLVTAAKCLGCSGADDAPFLPQPEPGFVVAAKPPPPVSGGTLIVTRSGLAVAADSDRDRVFAVDLVSGQKVVDIALQENDEPGRLVEDAEGLIHVVLRRGGAVATLDPAAGKVTARTSVCAAPRGLAHDPTLDVIHVACAGGELVTLQGGQVTREVQLDSDLRDAVIQDGQLFVSRFRDAELLAVSPEGLLEQRITLYPLSGVTDGTAEGNASAASFNPEVAWKTIPMSSGIAMVHQRAMTTPVNLDDVVDAYGGGGECHKSIVHGTVSLFHRGAAYSDGEIGVIEQAMVGVPLSGSILPVDLAADEARGSAPGRIAIVSAGSGTVVIMSAFDFESPGDGCGLNQAPAAVVGGPVAVAWAPSLGKFVVQTREPAGIVVVDDAGRAAATVDAGGVSVADTGHQMFHSNPGGGAALACASCHPEGRDDGRVWSFAPIGARRTPTLGGGVLHTAPLHWDGDMADLGAIVAEVFVRRMGGVPVGPRKVEAFSDWIDALPAFRPDPVVDTGAVGRGRALFDDKAVGCADCHSGPRYTNNLAKDVGTGQPFQVPPLLGLGGRAPYMHDGCAPTLHDRFGPCGGGDKHGHTSQLTSAQIDDLVAYLRQL